MEGDEQYKHPFEKVKAELLVESRKVSDYWWFAALRFGKCGELADMDDDDFFELQDTHGSKLRDYKDCRDGGASQASCKRGGQWTVLNAAEDS